jgi:hypothetical protein
MAGPVPAQQAAARVLRLFSARDKLIAERIGIVFESGR